MNFRTMTLLGLSSLALCLLAITACDPAANVVLPEGKPATGGDGDTGQVVPFNVSLSANRSRIVRDDNTQGGAVLTATSSVSATFDWQPTANADILDINFPDGEGTQSVLTIVRVNADPGQDDGRTITFTVTATEVTDTGVPRVVTRSITLRVVRPEGSLAANVSAPEGSTIAPGQTIVLSAIMAGGAPSPVNPAAPQPLCPTNAQGELDLDASDCTALLGDDANDSVVYDTANQPYAVTWLAEENLQGNDSAGSFARQCDLCLFDGDTISMVAYEAPRGIGNIVFSLDVSDSRGTRFPTTLSATVQSLNVLTVADAAAASSDVPPGTSVDLSASGAGGEPPYSMTFELLGVNPLGSLGSTGCSSLADDDAVCTVAYNAPGTEDGAVQARVTVQDAVNAVATEIIALTVASPLPLKVQLSSKAGSIQPNTQSKFEASVVGGAPPYTLCYNDTDGIGNIIGGGSGCGPITVAGTTYSKCVCNIGSSDADKNGTVAVLDEQTYQAPSFGGNAVIGAAVQDQVGNVATAADLRITVNSGAASGGDGGTTGAGEVTVALSVADPQVCLGETTTVTATGQGGVTPYTFTFSLSGAAAGESIAPSAASASSTAQYTAPTSAAGSRTIRVDVTEPGGSNDSDTIPINPATKPNVSFSPSTRPVCYSSTSPISAAAGLDVLISNDIEITGHNWLAKGRVGVLADFPLVAANVYDNPAARGAVFNVTQAVEDLAALSGITVAQALLNGTSFTLRIEVTDKCGTVPAEQEIEVAKNRCEPDRPHRPD